MAIVTKQEFARQVGRTPSAISNWIASGKLSASLVGTGNRARIDTEKALAELGENLHLGQQLAQESPVAVDPGGSFAPVASDADRRRLLRARAEREETALALTRITALEKTGRWIKANDAAEAWSRELAGLVRAVETWLAGEAADRVAALADPRPRDIGRVLRDGFRELRHRLVEAADGADG